MKSVTTLNRVGQLARARVTRRAELEAQAAAWVAEQLAHADEELELAVMAALADEHSVTSVATEYTVSGKTPNRTAIHRIKRERSDYTAPLIEDAGPLPFEWVAREVKTRAGSRTVYDLVAITWDFGPEDLVGTYTWRYDNGELDPVITEDEPYPITEFYKAVLDKWVAANPYPGGE